MSEFTDKVEALNKGQQNRVNRNSDIIFYSKEEISLSEQEKIEADSVIDDLAEMTREEIIAEGQLLEQRVQVGSGIPC